VVGATHARCPRWARLGARWCVFASRGGRRESPDETYKERGLPGLGEEDLATMIATPGPTGLGRMGGGSIGAVGSDSVNQVPEPFRRGVVEASRADLRTTCVPPCPLSRAESQTPSAISPWTLYGLKCISITEETNNYVI
jgi:hypothetical protein